MMPLENTSRWPRLLSQRGRNESWATKLARNGKPLKLVLPPVNRIRRGADLQDVEQDTAQDAVAEDELRLLGEHRRDAVDVGRSRG